MSVTFGTPYKGKVCDVYPFWNRNDKGFILKAYSDRISTDDIIRGSVPGKGVILNQISIEVFRYLVEQRFPTAYVETNGELPPNMMIQEMVEQRFDIELIYRLYLTGSLYKQCVESNSWKTVWGDLELIYPDIGFEWYRFVPMLATPKTKSDEHDEPISEADIVNNGIMTQSDLDEWKSICERLINSVTEGFFEPRKLVLLDTKFEAGRSQSGKLVLCDEICTPDSSRFAIGTPESIYSNASVTQLPKENARQLVDEGSRAMGVPKDKYQLSKMDISKVQRVYEDQYRIVTGRDDLPANPFDDPDDALSYAKLWIGSKFGR